MAKKPPALKYHEKPKAKKKLDTVSIAAVGVICLCLIVIALLLVLQPAPEPQEEEPVQYCGDGECSAFETCENCPVDCGACEEPEGPVCGDFVCDEGETCDSCPEDCGTCPEPEPEAICGDGECDNGETCDLCPEDCGECPEPRPSNVGSEEDCGDCILVYGFHYNAFGDDNFNLNDEYVRFKNRCDFACDLTGWSVTNKAAFKYVFPKFTVPAQGKFTLYSGSGTDTSDRLYWDSRYMPFPEVWSNADDMLFLRDTTGVVVYSKFYGW